MPCRDGWKGMTTGTAYNNADASKIFLIVNSKSTVRHVSWSMSCAGTMVRIDEANLAAERPKPVLQIAIERMCSSFRMSPKAEY